jgi:hypothetical protein
MLFTIIAPGPFQAGMLLPGVGFGVPSITRDGGAMSAS